MGQMPDMKVATAMLGKRKLEQRCRRRNGINCDMSKVSSSWRGECTYIDMRHNVGALHHPGFGVVLRGVRCWGRGACPWGQSCGNELLVSEDDELYYRNVGLLF